MDTNMDDELIQLEEETVVLYDNMIIEVDQPEEVTCTWPFRIENISVVQAPLLKIYYWESADIDGLNEKLNSGKKCLVHNCKIPTAQMNSCQLRLVFWIRSNSVNDTEITLKRRQNCNCLAYTTRVGFNQYRKLYHCPHRHLVNVTQEKFIVKCGDLVALSFVIYFYFLGEHKLTFELSCNDLSLYLNFFLDIVCFDVQKCLITKQLLPVEMSEPRRFVQALWVRNITMQDLKFNFSTKSRGLKIINSNLTIPRQSVWPLMVEFRPTGPVDELKILQSFDNRKTTQDIFGTGYLGDMEMKTTLPLADYDCFLHRYITYPCILQFDVGPDEERSLMVNVHNYDQKCVEFHWQNYVINNLFSITYEPETFRLKGHHSKLCVIHLRSFDRPLHFVRVPLVLEVHRIFDRSTQIAKDLLSEIESIDDPKWKQESYMEHVLLQADLKIRFKERPTINFNVDTSTISTPRYFTPRHSATTAHHDSLPLTVKTQTLTVFEKLFWEYLSQSDFMRPDKKAETRSVLDYEQVVELYSNSLHKKCPPSDLTKNHVIKLVSLLIADAIRDISKNWIFVPPDSYERPL